MAFPEEDGLLGGPLFQYMETDWELLRRVAGRMGTVVAADTRNSRPGVYLGMPGGKHRQAGDVLESAAVFEGRRYYALREKGLKIARQDFICYDITTTENLELGDKVSYQGRELVVCRREIGYSGSMVVYRCRLAGKTYAMAVEECNPYLAGLTLEGSVTRCVGEACGVFFDVMYLRERAMVDRHILAEALTGEGHTYMFKLDYRIVHSEYDDYIGQNGFLQIKCNECTYGEITYVLDDVDGIKVPTDFPTAENAPYTGRGFTGSKNIVLPELVQDMSPFVDGDILGIYDAKTGILMQQFVYDSESGWLLK